VDPVVRLADDPDHGPVLIVFEGDDLAWREPQSLCGSDLEQTVGIDDQRSSYLLARGWATHFEHYLQIGTGQVVQHGHFSGALERVMERQLDR
jgi:hypothetical protein